MSRAPAVGHTAALQPYIVRRPSRLYGLVVRAARRAPWWSLSFTVHAALLVTLWHLPYRLVAPGAPSAVIQVDLVDEMLFREFAEPFEIPPDDPRADEVVAEPQQPPSPVEISIEEVDPALDPPPLVVELSAAVRVPPPSFEPPPPVPIFEVVPPPTSPARVLYAPRTRRARAQSVGGRAGTTPRAERAVQAGLRWLARAQEPDGSWSCRRWGGGGDNDVGVTGLGVLAFLGAGYTQHKGPFQPVVRRALVWLRASQKPTGQFAWRTFYEQGIATMAVTEAYALTASPQLGRMAQKAIGYICRLQPEHGGFRYGGPVPRNDGDLSVTAWQILAIKSALSAGLDVPPHAVERARTFLANTYRGDGTSAYLVGSRGHAPATTAVGMLCRLFLGGDYDEQIRAAAEHLLDHETSAGGAGKGKNRLVGDLYYTYYATTAMFQMGGEHWAQWNQLFRDPLLAAQVLAIRDGGGRHVRGSWDPASHHWGRRGGRVYTTAMALLSLEAYYRFLPLYK